MDSVGFRLDIGGFCALPFRQRLEKNCGRHCRVATPIMVVLGRGIDSLMIAVIDYKAGNLTSVLKALRHLGAEPEVTDGDLAPVESAERIVLPGVGHFQATERLDATGLTRAIRAAIARGVPFLGICVGMQWLYAGSSESPNQPGLGHFAESCARFPDDTEKVPHVGWNSLEMRAGSRLLAGVNPGEFVYFTHSYRAPITADAAAITHYIGPFAAAVERANVMGVQFHPEKSGETGLNILRNFLLWKSEGIA